MAFAHNAMLRGINCIYLQAPHVSSARDINDFLFLVKAWASWVLHHHQLEETRMFPGFERVAGKPGLLKGNVDQHHEFEPGLKALVRFGVEETADTYRGPALQTLIDSFAKVLSTHLHDEIQTLLSLRAYDGPALLKVYKDCEAAAAGEHPKSEVFPMVLMLCDKTFQGGNNWPEMPWYAPYMVDWIFGWPHRGAWRFLPANIHGQPRALAFVP